MSFDKGYFRVKAGENATSMFIVASVVFVVLFESAQGGAVTSAQKQTRFFRCAHDVTMEPRGLRELFAPMRVS